MAQFWQYSLVGLAGRAAYALMALVVVVVDRGSGILNFARGAMAIVAAYVLWEISDAGNGSLPVIRSVLIGVLVGIALGMAFYVMVARRLRRPRWGDPRPISRQPFPAVDDS